MWLGEWILVGVLWIVVNFGAGMKMGMDVFTDEHARRIGLKKNWHMVVATTILLLFGLPIAIGYGLTKFPAKYGKLVEWLNKDADLGG